MPDAADRADAQATIADATLTHTASGDTYTIAGTADGDVIAQADDSDDTLAVTPRRLLTLLKQGEYYLPDHPAGFQDALRDLRDTTFEDDQEPQTGRTPQ